LLFRTKPVFSYRPIEPTPTAVLQSPTYIGVVANRHGVKGMNMQTAQMNSPRFSYQAAAPTITSAPRTLDDFRPVHGSYAGSFSGKTSQPIWIAVGMIAVVASIATGVNMYSSSHAAKIESAPLVQIQHPLVEPAASADVPVATPAAPIAKEIAPPDVPVAETPKSSAIDTPPKARASVAAKPAPVITRKAAPLPVEPAQMVAPPEVAPAAPPIAEPAPVPLPIVIEKPITPAPAPVPDVPQVEPPKPQAN
jgi:hypothetical protein